MAQPQPQVEYTYDYTEETELKYSLIPTIRLFHESPAQMRCIVGPVGSGKTTAACWEVCRYIPFYMFERYGIRKTRGVVVRNCFDDITEILTEKRGWQLFVDLKPGDKVAMRAEDGSLVFTLPTHYYQAPYSGEMVGIKSQNSDLLVTPDHHLFTSKRYSRKKVWQDPKHVVAQDIYGVGELYRLCATATDWRGEATDYSEDFFEFLGFWFAEGYAGVYDRNDCAGKHYRFVVTQNDSAGYVEDLLERNNFQYGKCAKKDSNCFNYTISVASQSVKNWVTYLADYGHATTKYLPQWVKDAPKGHLKAFLEGYQRGDGSFKSGPKNCDHLYTASKSLADDLQEVVFKSGRYAVVNKVISPTEHGQMYILTLMTPLREKPLIKKKHWRKEQYDGTVYCVEVPTHVVYVRRNGKSCWCGQTYAELVDTTMDSMFEWFDWGDYKAGRMNYTLKWDAPDGGEPITIEILFRSCDRPDQVKKFKSLQVTWYWIDESIEVSDEIKRMLKNRIGRMPRKSPVRFGIETTNPPDVEHTTYNQFKWHKPPPGPVPSGIPLAKHAGFWQPPYENVANLRPGYYDDLRADYADSPDWADMYIDGKPGQLIRGKLVYDNFLRTYHIYESKEKDAAGEIINPSLRWGGQDLYRGWDNSGNTPACVVVCPVTPQRLHIFREFVTVKENIVDFANRVKVECNIQFPNAVWTDYGDPAGKATFSTKDGMFTSNTKLMNDECGINVTSGEQNFKVRQNVVDQALLKRDGILVDPSCVRLINGWLGGYHYPEMANMPGRFAKDPAKNKYAHVHEALQYVLTRLHVSAAPPISDADVYPDEMYEETY